MKRRFVECAILLGVVMSVMFLAQTQDGLGHSKNMHDPVFDVDSTGNEVEKGNGNDPRGRRFMNTDGSVVGTVTGEGWYYRGGLLNGATEAQTNDPNHPGHPGDTTDQMIYVLKCNARGYVGSWYCEAKIEPSISYVYALPQRAVTFQGWGKISLKFSNVCYHKVKGPFWNRSCEEKEREGTLWKTGQAISIKVTLNEYAEKRTGSFGGNVGVDYASISAGYTHGSEEKYSDLYARGFGIKASLLGSDSVVLKQDKSADASGYVENARTGDLGAVRNGVDDHECPGSGSQ